MANLIYNVSVLNVMNLIVVSIFLGYVPLVNAGGRRAAISNSTPVCLYIIIQHMQKVFDVLVWLLYITAFLMEGFALQRMKQ